MSKKEQNRGYDSQGRPVNPPSMTQAEKDKAKGILGQPEIPEDEPQSVPSDDTSKAVAAAQVDPEVLASAVQDYLRENKDLLRPVQPGPDGTWVRNYEGEAALRVYGGVEVKHGPDFMPGAPEYLLMYEGKDGEMTSDPTLARMENGKPVLTDQYKYWLHKRLQGDRLDGNVRSDIQVGQFVPDDEGVTL